MAIASPWVTGSSSDISVIVKKSATKIRVVTISEADIRSAFSVISASDSMAQVCAPTCTTRWYSDSAKCKTSAAGSSA